MICIDAYTDLGSKASSELVVLKNILLAFPNIKTGSTTAAEFDFAEVAKGAKMAFDGRAAHGGAELGDLRFGKLADLRADSFAHGFKRIILQDVHPVGKLTIGGDDRAKQVFDERRRIIRAFVPTELREFQRVIIFLFRFGDFRLKGNVFPYLIPATIQKKRRQKA